MSRFLLPFGFLATFVITIGVGCAPGPAPAPAPPPPAAQPVVTQPASPPPAPVVVSDPYQGWGTIMPGGAVSLRIPPGCQAEGAAGSTYVTCPTPGNPTPTPDLVASSDGLTVDIKRWEDQSWEHWDKVIASLRVLTPLDREVKITIQK